MRLHEIHQTHYLRMCTKKPQSRKSHRLTDYLTEYRRMCVTACEDVCDNVQCVSEVEEGCKGVREPSESV